MIEKTVDETMFMAAVIRAKEAGDYVTNEEWAIRYAADKIKRLKQENERLREAIRASQNGTICPLCNSMPHNDSCPALNGEAGDE